MKHIFFFDLDNTIYFTQPNKEILMTGLYSRLDQEKLDLPEQTYAQAKQEMLRTPFLKVAGQYQFPADVIKRMTAYLAEREVTEPLIPSKDYPYIKSLRGRKFIITAGFPKQQLSKINMLGISADFEDIKVVDVSRTSKKEVFQELISAHSLDKKDILVIGDDANSEIQAGLELGLETFLIDPDNWYPDAASTYRGTDFSKLSAAAGQA